MSATAEQTARLRRMTGLAGSAEYTDSTLAGYIERYPLLDENGEEPYEWDSSTSPPHQDENTDWIPTYDLNAAAADVWQERASALAANYDFSADGGSYHRSQAYEQFMSQCRHYRARRVPTTVKAIQWPPEYQTDETPWIINLPEADE